MRYIFFIFCAVLFSCKPQKDAAGNTVSKKLVKNKTLVAVNLMSLRIEAFPKYDKGGEDWDAYAPFATKPDLYALIKWNDIQVYKSETFTECEFGQPVAFVTGLPCELKPFDQVLLVEIFDEDGVSSNDNVGYFNLSLMDYKDWKFVVLTSPDKTLSVGMELEWVYK